MNIQVSGALGALLLFFSAVVVTKYLILENFRLCAKKIIIQQI